MRPALHLPSALRGCALGAALLLTVQTAAAEPAAAIAMQGDPALRPGFTAFPYVDADAPRGGSVVYVADQAQTFNSLNPFIINGEPATGVNQLVVATLMMRSLDEPFTYYPLIARTVETPPDRSWVEFQLDERARFSDGAPITAEDVKFTMELLRDKGRPNARNVYGQIASVDIAGLHRIRFTFKNAANRELALSIAGMPVLAKHATDVATFDRPTLKPFVGSGPYVIAAVQAGASVTFARQADWWARDLPTTRGQYNFDTIRIDYFREANAKFAAFMTGQIDVWPETDAVRWLQDFAVPAVAEGRLIRQELSNGLPRPMDAFVFNTRRPVFADRRVREAITLMFDFEWINQTLFYGQYQRTCSYFENSELSACGRPADARERALLAPFPDAVQPAVMDGTWSPPVLDGTGRDRPSARKALELLKEAGWTVRDGAMRNAAGAPLAFTIVLVDDRATERMALNLADSARRLGVAVTIRVMDGAQAQQRRQNFDFDMMRVSWQSSLSPGNEQRFRWSSAAAATPGSFNYAGAASPAADAMIAAFLKAETRQDFVAAVRAFDRVLISGNYVVPLYFGPKLWLARWSRTARPDKPALAVGAYGDLLASDPVLAHMRAP